MGSSTKTALILALIAASVTLLSVYNYNNTEITVSDGDNLDCGFTQDFSDFINANGTHFNLFRLFYFPIQST